MLHRQIYQAFQGIPGFAKGLGCASRAQISGFTGQNQTNRSKVSFNVLEQAGHMFEITSAQNGP